MTNENDIDNTSQYNGNIENYYCVINGGINDIRRNDNEYWYPIWYIDGNIVCVLLLMKEKAWAIDNIVLSNIVCGVMAKVINDSNLMANIVNDENG